MDATSQGKTARRGLAAVALFYLLIAFEFFYMASPFAVYFYSVYRPWLDFLGAFPQLAWLAAFFLPHIVAETNCALINLHNAVGIVLFGGGLLAFCVGAGQVYYHKLARKGSVIGGVYRYVRHPQYLSLAISGFGLLLLWPRYIVLAMYVTVLFAYLLLARLEERECLAKFGKPYEDYMRNTGMFLPFRLPSIPGIRRLWASRSGRAAVLVGAYLLTMTAALGAARGVEYLSVRSLWACYTADSATVSLVKMDGSDLDRIVKTAIADTRVKAMLAAGGEGVPVRYLNYVLPADRYVSEIPMNPIGPDEGNHFLLTGYAGNVYRIVITRAVPRDADIAGGREILFKTIYTVPLAEVLVDAGNWQVIGVQDPVKAQRYENMPMPLF